MYYPFIADFLRVFPKEQIKVVRYEDYVSKPSEVINEVGSFLELCTYLDIFIAHCHLMSYAERL